MAYVVARRVCDDASNPGSYLPEIPAMNSLYEVTDTLLIWQTVGCLIGLCVSVLLIQLVRAAWSSVPQRGPGILLTVALLVWNLGGFANAALIIAGYNYLSLPARMACAFGYSGLTSLTWAVLSVWGLAVVGKWRKRSLAFLQVLAAGMGVVITFWLWRDAVGGNAPLSRTGLRILAEASLYSFASIGVLLAMSRRPAWTTRLCTGLMAFGALGPIIAASLIPIYGRLPQAVRVALSVYAEQSVNYVAVAAFLLLARLRYTDVLVERVLRCVVAILAGLSLWYSVRTWISWLPQHSHLPAALALTAGVVMAGLMLVTPPLNAGIHRLTEKIFQTPDFDAKLEELSEVVRQTVDEEEIFVRGQAFVRELFEFPVVEIAEVAALPEAIERSLAGEEVLEFSPGSRALHVSEMDGDAMVPVRQNGQLTHAIALGRSTEQRGFLASEVSFLRKLAQVLGVQLNLIRSEREKREQEHREALLRHQTTEAELRALRAQINPHFLFNALNTIADLIVADAQKAERMTERLADMFRSLLTHSQKPMITVREEIEFVRQYLEIEEARFRDHLRVCIQVDPALADVQVPAMILQPLVENAIKHGLAPKLEGGLLRISVRRTGSQLLLTVEDNGVGLASSCPPYRNPNPHSNCETSKRSTGVGLANTSQRLRTVYGVQAELLVESPQQQGCRVTIRIPS
jgi:two-component system LytT family sensor kinase